jgi:alanyl-tRNA synthetase
MRVIADHARTTAFLVAEGIFPDRSARPYVLRRVMRRAIRHGHRLGIGKPFLHEVALKVVDLMGDQYPELRERRDLVASVAEQEEVRFRETIDRGLKILDEEIANLRSANQSIIGGDVAFKLYDTYGFPLDLTEVISRERALGVDTAGFDKALEEQKARSAGSKVGEEAVSEVYRAAVDRVFAREPGGVRFVGYERDEAEATVVAIVRGNELAEHAKEGDHVSLVVDATPFYGESGGQVGDQGLIVAKEPAHARERSLHEHVVDFRFKVEDTQKPLAGLVIHEGEVLGGEVKVGDRVHLSVDVARRNATRRNHSATHLLHWALRTVLGEQATQKGSLVGPDKLRFDFSHGKAVAPEELARIEDLVNEKVLTDAPVETQVMSMDEAKKSGAMAIFEEKYGDTVRVLTMTKDSVELCGGTHARALGEIGLFKIVSEGGVAAGVRRIEAATGMNALAYVREIEGTLKSAAGVLKASSTEIPEKLERVLEHERALQKEVAELKRKLAMGGGGGIDAQLGSARDIPGGKVLAVRAEVTDAATLRELAEKLRDKLGDAVVLVGAAGADKAMLVLTVSKSLTDRYKAGELIKGVAQLVGGSGGGRPDMAQAGGTDVAKLDEAIQSLYARFG